MRSSVCMRSLRSQKIVLRCDGKRINPHRACRWASSTFTRPLLTTGSYIFLESYPFDTNSENKRILVPKLRLSSHSSFNGDDASIVTSNEILNHMEKKYWHDESFMKDDPPEAKDDWLESVLTDDKKGVDSAAFNIVLEAWSHSKKINAPQKAEEWILRMEDFHTQLVLASHGDHLNSTLPPLAIYSVCQPTVESYNAVIRAWARCNPKRVKAAIVRAERWINQMEELSHNADKYLSDSNESDKQKQKLHDLKKDYCHDGSGDGELSTSPLAGPNTESYNLFLSILCMGRKRNHKRNVADATRAQGILETLVQKYERTKSTHAMPNVETLNRVMIAWTKCTKEVTPSVADRCMELLGDAENYGPWFRLNSKSYTIAMVALGRVAELKATIFSWEQRQGNKITSEVNSINGNDEVFRSEEILQSMHRIHNDGANLDIVPDTIAYNTIIKNWAAVSNKYNPKAAVNAEKVLAKMEEFDITPDDSTYIMIMLSWTRRESLGSAQKAHWWLNHITRNYVQAQREGHSVDVTPNVMAFNTVMKGYKKCWKPWVVDELMSDLVRYGDEYPAITPDANSFSIVISAWSLFETYGKDTNQSVSPGFLRAYEWLKKFIQYEQKGISLPLNKDNSEQTAVVTSLDAYVNVLKATSQTKSSDIKVLEVALDTFSELEKSRHHLTSSCYKYLLDVVLKVTLPNDNERNERGHYLKTILMSCCENGLLSNKVFQVILEDCAMMNDHGWIKNDFDYGIIKDLLGDWPIPRSWHRNVLPPEEKVKKYNFDRLLKELQMHVHRAK